jgi:hypothetical protein
MGYMQFVKISTGVNDMEERNLGMTVELNIYTLHMLNKTSQVHYTNTYAKAKLSIAFETLVVFFICYCNVFG